MSRNITGALVILMLASLASCSSKPTPQEVYETRLEKRRQLLEETRMHRELKHINRQLTYDAMYY